MLLLVKKKRIFIPMNVLCPLSCNLEDFLQICDKLQARPLLSLALEDGEYDELVDPFLEKNYNLNEMARMVACAAASIRHSARKRPRMSQV